MACSKIDILPSGDIGNIHICATVSRGECGAQCSQVKNVVGCPPFGAKNRKISKIDSIVCV